MTAKNRRTSTSRIHMVVAGMVRNTPYLLLGTLLLFSMAAIVAGEIYGAYSALWWWDDMLHTLAGVIFSTTGFLIVYFLNGRYSMAISPLLIATFAFTFAITIGVLWEIFEFTIDLFFHTALQQWDLPMNSILMGQSYQGVGLRDTMSDLIVTWVGASVTSIFIYLIYKYKRVAALTAMRRTFFWQK
jgi:hypothetical protein